MQSPRWLPDGRQQLWYARKSHRMRCVANGETQLDGSASKVVVVIFAMPQEKSYNICNRTGWFLRLLIDFDVHTLQTRGMLHDDSQCPKIQWECHRHRQ